jgi:hypothetical protein
MAFGYKKQKPLTETARGFHFYAIYAYLQQLPLVQVALSHFWPLWHEVQVAFLAVAFFAAPLPVANTDAATIANINVPKNIFFIIICFKC